MHFTASTASFIFGFIFGFKFDADGNLVEFPGRVILLDYQIARDPDVVALEKYYRPKVDAITKVKIGTAKVYLDGMNCRYVECNMGNMISKALIMSSRGIKQQKTNASIALFASGDIRASIKVGKITKYDVGMALPFPNPLGEKYKFPSIVNRAVYLSIVLFFDEF